MLKNKKTYLIPIIGFLLIIVISSIILHLPICNYKEISMKDAIFTATSGITTTGFTKMPLVSQFNFLGQFVLAVLMEIGALGFIIFISFFWSISNRKMKMSDIIVINDNIGSVNYGIIKEHSIFIFKLMIKAQLIGIALLAIRFIPLFGFLKGIWYSIFHVISAFSNTGFDLFGANSLYPFYKDVYIQTILIGLMIIGSIGILVIEDLKSNKSRKFRRLKMQTKIAIIYTLVLLIFPTLFMSYFEKDVSLWNGLFMSASSRSTGFSIVNLKDFSNGSKIMLIVLMFIGGSPASTSGGIKIITLAIILSTILSTLKGKNETIMFWRKVPDSIVRKAFTIMTVFIAVLTVSSFVFYHYNNINLFNIIFESVSAITNTGLSISNFNDLNMIGEFIILALMFIGRVGPLTMVMVFVNENSKNKFVEYPNENIIL